MTDDGPTTPGAGTAPLDDDRRPRAELTAQSQPIAASVDAPPSTADRYQHLFGKIAARTGVLDDFNAKTSGIAGALRMTADVARISAQTSGIAGALDAMAETQRLTAKTSILDAFPADSYRDTFDDLGASPLGLSAAYPNTVDGLILAGAETPPIPRGWAQRQSGLVIPQSPEAAMAILGCALVALLAFYWWVVDRTRAEIFFTVLGAGSLGAWLYRAILKSSRSEDGQ